MTKRILFILILGLALANFSFAFAQNNSSLQADPYFCVVYFTYIGCPNCAHTDPIVLTDWPKKYSNLVVIEYGWLGGDWENPNSKFFGDYAEKCHLQAAVPQLVISKDKNCLGRIDVPRAESYIQQGEFNECPLIDGAVSFEELDIRQLPGLPKIWANDKILIALGNNEWLFQWNGEKPKALNGLKFERVEPQRAEFSGIAFPGSEFIPYVDFENAVKINLSDIPSVSELMKPEAGFISAETENTENTEEAEEAEEAEETEDFPEETTENEIKIPFFGELKTGELSLPILTFLLGIADGFNPCAFFVLTFLLAALIGLAGARKKIFLVGGIFIFFSFLFYFLFMSVLLNVFKFGGKIVFLTFIAGMIAVFAGIVNIKDYFAFQKGISLTLPKSRKAKFMEKVKNLSLARSTFALIITTVVIAATVNIYELLCTVGFPMVYVRILTLRELPSLQYFLYLIFYNLVYIIPLATIVLIFAITLGRKSFSQVWVRRLKLISGFMILFLGLVLIVEPKLLEDILTAFIIMVSSVLIGGIIIFIWHRLKKE